MKKLIHPLRFGATLCQAQATELIVQGGTSDRVPAVVTFTAPKELRGELSLTDKEGTSLPLQVDEAGRGVFVLPKLGKGSRATFTVGPKARTIFPVGVEVM